MTRSRNQTRGRTHRSVRRAGVLLAAGAAVVVGAPLAPAATAADVKIVEDGFDPSRFEIDQGDSVTWTNATDETQTVTAEDGAFDSGPLEPGETFTQAFTESGTFEYGSASADPETHVPGTVVVRETDGTGDGGDDEGTTDSSGGGSPPESSDPDGHVDDPDPAVDEEPPAEEDPPAEDPSASDEPADGTAVPGAQPVAGDEEGEPARLPAPVIRPARAVVLGASASVQAQDNEFVPSSVQIDVGDSVTWTNTGDNAHTVTADDGSFNSGNLDPGDTFSHTFTEAGTFDYICQYHVTLGMEGQVVVRGEEGGAPGEQEQGGGTQPAEDQGGEAAGTTEGAGQPAEQPAEATTEGGLAFTGSSVGLLLVLLVLLAAAGAVLVLTAQHLEADHTEP